MGDTTKGWMKTGLLVLAGFLVTWGLSSVLAEVMDLSAMAHNTLAFFLGMIGGYSAIVVAMLRDWIL